MYVILVTLPAGWWTHTAQSPGYSIIRRWTPVPSRPSGQGGHLPPGPWYSTLHSCMYNYTTVSVGCQSGLEQQTPSSVWAGEGPGPVHPGQWGGGWHTGWGDHRHLVEDQTQPLSVRHLPGRLWEHSKTWSASIYFTIYPRNPCTLQETM